MSRIWEDCHDTHSSVVVWRPHGQDDHAAARANFSPVNSCCGLAAVGRMMCNDAARDSPTKGAYSTSPLAGSRSGLANLDR
jgi:hypothetical protein